MKVVSVASFCTVRKWA